MAQQYKYPLSSFSIDEAKINLNGLATEIGAAITSGKINTVYDGVSRADGYVDVVFRSALDGYEKAVLDTLIINHDGGDATPYQQVHLSEIRDQENRIVMVPDVRLGSEVVLATHNFCDPCTWYSESLRQSEELTMDDEDGYVFRGTMKNWIDIANGRVLREDKISESISHGYRVKITVDGYELSEKLVNHEDPDSADFIVNYDDGYITFLRDSYFGKTVNAEYSFSYGSGWYLVPFENTEVRIERAEVQFSEDVGFHDSIEMVIYIGNPYDPNTWYEYKKAVYKCMDNFIDEAEGAFPLIPPLPGHGGTKKARYGFPFRYSTARPLSYAQGVFLVVRMTNHRKFDGERATATFYCTIVDE